jgi:glycosyltransferase involved in cell wall biosynthesis
MIGNNNNTKTTVTILAGWEKISDKHSYQLETFSKQSKEVYAITSLNELTVDIDASNFKIIELNTPKRVIAFFTLLIKNLTSDIIVILSPYGHLSIIYFFFSKMFRCKIITVEWGPIGVINKKKWLEIKLSRFQHRNSNVVWYKEPYMLNLLNNINVKNRFFLHNAIATRVNGNGNGKDKNKDIDFLWVNRFCGDRRPDLVIQAAERLSNLKKFNLVMMGSDNDMSQKTWRQEGVVKIKNNFLPGTVSILGFVDPQKYYDRSRFFIMLAEHIYGNNSLIEAMSLGLVPIVNRSESIENIVIDGVNGIVCDYSLMGIESAMDYAISLSNEHIDELSKNAIKHIKEKFSDKEWERKYINLLNSL